MSNETLSVLTSTTSLLISIAVFWVAFSQMKRASAKVKLDLYNRRFNIYQITLDYYFSLWNDPYPTVTEKSFLFTKAFRESKFLFKDNDNVYKTLEKIHKKGAKIRFYKEYKYEMEHNLTKDKLDLDTLHKESSEALLELENDLIALENYIQKYIQFNSTSGWSLFK